MEDRKIIWVPPPVFWNWLIVWASVVTLFFGYLLHRASSVNLGYASTRIELIGSLSEVKHQAEENLRQSQANQRDAEMNRRERDVLIEERKRLNEAWLRFREVRNVAATTRAVPRDVIERIVPATLPALPDPPATMPATNDTARQAEMKEQIEELKDLGKSISQTENAVQRAP